MRFFVSALVLLSIFLEGEGLSVIEREKYENIFQKITTTNKDKWIKKVESLKDNFSISIENKNILYDDNSEGITFSVRELDKKVLVISSFKEGYLSRYKFYFTYSKEENKFNLYKVYFLSFNESCRHDLNAVYEVENKLFKGIAFSQFDEERVYKALYEKPIWINKKMQLFKIQSVELISLYNEIFKFFKNKNIKFKEYIEDLVDKECNLKYYLNEKYFFKQNIKLSNNIAFFFEQAGYYQEAIYLLKKILEKYPNRTVAHYNIADAYWAIDDKKKAKEHYNIYIKQMKAKGKEKRIPKVVKRRVSFK